MSSTHQSRQKEHHNRKAPGNNIPAPATAGGTLPRVAPPQEAHSRSGNKTRRLDTPASSTTAACTKYSSHRKFTNRPRSSEGHECVPAEKKAVNCYSVCPHVLRLVKQPVAFWGLGLWLGSRCGRLIFTKTSPLAIPDSPNTCSTRNCRTGQRKMIDTCLQMGEGHRRSPPKVNALWVGVAEQLASSFPGNNHPAPRFPGYIHYEHRPGDVSVKILGSGEPHGSHCSVSYTTLPVGTRRIRRPRLVT